MIQKNKLIVKLFIIFIAISVGVILYFLYPDLFKKQNIQVEKVEKSIEFQKLDIQRVITNQKYYEYTHGVNSPIFNSKNEKLLYTAGDLFSLPKIYSLDISSQQRQELSNSFGFVSQVIWSPDYNYAIIEMSNLKYELGVEQSVFLVKDAPDGVSTFWFYDLSNNKTIYLDWKMQAVSWSPQGDKIAYIYQEDKKHYTLYTSNPDGSQAKKIIDLRGEGTEYFKDIAVANQEDNYLYYWDGGLAWSPLGNDIIYWGKGSPGLILVGLDGNEKILKQAELVDGAQWSPDGNLILYSVQQTKDAKVILALMNASDNFKEQVVDDKLEFNVPRCVWSKKDAEVVYCLSLAELGNKFYKINLNKKEITGLIDLDKYESRELFSRDSLSLAWVKDKNDKGFLLQEKKRKITYIFLDPKEEKLYFKFFDILYAINLKEKVQE
ncbi:MAG: DPP IV N-terminal domain-containing protein [Candidatus Gribaldobacteria bacterium]|nr:DPP IV N-terminal domain-containing protein [Candidatus Gribaldobacteria bacterium]